MTTSPSLVVLQVGANASEKVDALCPLLVSTTSILFGNHATFGTGCYM